MVSKTQGEKRELRARMRALRRAIPVATRRTASRKAASIAMHVLRGRRTVAVYLSGQGELGTGPLIEALLRRGHRVCVPRMLHASMVFTPITSTTPLKTNRFGISEPLASRRGERVDAVVLPLLAFDAAGNRLGQGGGHYDRALARPRPYRRPLRLGFGYAAQQLPRVPFSPHDVRLDGVVTEKGVTWPTG